MGKKMTVLVHGAGIGGLALAWWLRRFGFVPTVIERAPALREGGYLIDFFGLGYDVIERMGLASKLAEQDLRIPELVFVDADDRRRGSVDVEVIRELLDGRGASLLR